MGGEVGRRIRAGLIGFGTIGTGVARILIERREAIATRLGADLELVRIADVDTRRDRGLRLPRGMLVPDAARILEDPDIDIVIELVGGTTVARDFVLAALDAGKDVVTANKALLAHCGGEIFRRAEARGAHLGFEASVGGGIPIVRTLREALAGDRNREVTGIVNGTSNYVLSRMTRDGGEYGDVVAEAQREGLAEADPSFDVDGVDAAHKLCLLVQLAFGLCVSPDAIPTEGIRGITQADIRYADALGYVIKPLALARVREEKLEARVHPTLVPKGHVLADVNGALNAVFVRGEALGTSIYVGLGAGMMPTATAVVADVIDAARARLGGYRGALPPLGYPLRAQRAARLLRPGDLQCAYYLRFTVVDRPGVLAAIAGILGQHRISLQSVIQQGPPGGTDGVVPVVMRTHRAAERDLRRALRAIDRLEVVREPSMYLRIEDELP